ncbi:C39 family peptidase [Paenibacillus hodogayensis]|uniref:C39 family peptidase n=1 Tax=Paenibacillus hodogayensis TaxID=279208 RepID=A0ABV5VP49_9BACL
MLMMLNLAKYLFTIFLILGLLFSSGVFSVLLYAKMTGKEFLGESPASSVVLAEGAGGGAGEAKPPPVVKPKPPSAMLDAPIVRQLPELPPGCEIVSLTMLLNYYGINKTKMEMVKEMVKDPTPARWENGAIAYWGNPSTGYVGDVTGKTRGFGIYHSGLFPTLKDNIPSAIDLTQKEFDLIERQIAEGFPVVIWTTIDYNVPKKWVTWDTPIGPIETTFMEHAVLLVGYDEQNVYVNDPLSGKKGQKINKEQFLATWDALGKQALSYN